jgi:hypothetical protein
MTTALCTRGGCDTLAKVLRDLSPPHGAEAEPGIHRTVHEEETDSDPGQGGRKGPSTWTMSSTVAPARCLAPASPAAGGKKTVVAVAVTTAAAHYYAWQGQDSQHCGRRRLKAAAPVAVRLASPEPTETVAAPLLPHCCQPSRYPTGPKLKPLEPRLLRRGQCYCKGCCRGAAELLIARTRLQRPGCQCNGQQGSYCSPPCTLTPGGVSA